MTRKMGGHNEFKLLQQPPRQTPVIPTVRVCVLVWYFSTLKRADLYNQKHTVKMAKYEFQGQVIRDITTSTLLFWTTHSGQVRSYVVRILKSCREVHVKTASITLPDMQVNHLGIKSFNLHLSFTQFIAVAICNLDSQETQVRTTQQSCCQFLNTQKF